MLYFYSAALVSITFTCKGQGGNLQAVALLTGADGEMAELPLGLRVPADKWHPRVSAITDYAINQRLEEWKAKVEAAVRDTPNPHHPIKATELRSLASTIAV